MTNNISNKMLPIIQHSTSQLKKTLTDLTNKQDEAWNQAFTQFNTGLNMLNDSLTALTTRLSIIEVVINISY